ncbi:MAG: uridine kinase, partial [Deltaproteobacteria bacterium]|nr:uridine kinase [Deltaproteobacteria bacterium]
AYFKYIMPLKQYADIVIKNNYDSHLDEFVDDYLLNMKL